MIIVRQAFDLWVIAERAKLLGSVHDTRTMRTCFARWQKVKQHTANLHVVAESHRAELDKRHLHSAFSRWRDVSGRRQNQALQADLVYENRVRSRSFRIWITSSRRLEHNDRVANNAHRFFAQRTGLKCWKTALAHRKQERWLVEREKESLRGVFETWMSATVQAVEDKRAIARFQHASNEVRILSSSARPYIN